MIHYFKDIKRKESNLVTLASNDELHTTKIVELPTHFTYPFLYTPHPLIVLAANEVNDYIQSRKDWHEELSHGKMFGVLLVELPDQQIGYLAGFSGNLAGSNHHTFFVPPVFDLLRPGDFFKVEEANISAINQKISEITKSASYTDLRNTLNSIRSTAESQLKEARESLKEAKKRREEERNNINAILLNISSKCTSTSSVASNTTPNNEGRICNRYRDESVTTTVANSAQEEQSTETGKYQKRLEELIKESQYQKAEYKRLERKIKANVAEKEAELRSIEEQISALKQERKTRSAALQMKLFEHFKMLNAQGETKDLCEIFEEVRHSIPPAGAGECALPKMLQYAYLHHLKPLAFGEFWWGESPKDEIRQHGHFYPSCKGKCEPILQHMLVGLDVDPNPLANDLHRNTALNILYEDKYIVAIEKPAGMLSTPGKDAIDSVSERLHQMYPNATGPMLVHRLDMATSGILIAAKTKEIHAQLQTLFEARKVEKIYTAILDGIPSAHEGCINLPLCLNPMDRPRQMVNYELGKEAITFYKVLATKGKQSLVQFDLQTGRTHQIRMHAAHPAGLNCPIKGDDLYGTHADRLYLHATKVAFTHPITGEKVILIAKVPFNL